MKIAVSDELALQKLPEVRGSYYFTDKDSVIFAGITTNLYARINRLKDLKEEDDKIRELWDQSEHLTIELRNSDMECLIWFKSLKKSFIPYLNNDIDFSANFVYLAFDFKNPPYVAIKENTQSNNFYIGPFRNRFFVRDLITVLTKNIHLPACPDVGFPCDLVKDDQCKGYCIPDKKLDIKAEIEKYYLSSNNDFADILNKKFQAFNDQLEFQKAEEVKVETRILLKYYQFLQFLNETKNINLELKFDDKIYTIENGLLAQVTGKESIDFREQNRQVQYRDTEKLAFNKNELDERWVVYNFIKNVQNNF